jgi:hypothetical protein
LTANPARWFYAEDKKAAKPVGPVDDAQLTALAQSGKLAGRDLVWRQGQGGWIKAFDVAGLFDATPPLPASPWPPFTASYGRWFARATVGQRFAAVGISLLAYWLIAMSIMGIRFFVAYFQDMHSDLRSLPSISSNTSDLVRPEWTYLVETIEDSYFHAKMNEYGSNGWELTYARRVVDPGEKPRYEVIMKKNRR